jgi:hypothetical protein
MTCRLLGGCANFAALTTLTLTLEGVVSGSGGFASFGNIVLGGINTDTGGMTIKNGRCNSPGPA